MNQGTLMPILDSVVVAAEEYTEQASVTDWPARLALVALIAGLIALALWGMRRGWQGRVARHSSMAEPSAFDAPASSGVLGLYLGRRSLAIGSIALPCTSWGSGVEPRSTSSTVVWASGVTVLDPS